MLGFLLLGLASWCLPSREGRNGQGNGHQYIIGGCMAATVAHAPLTVGKFEEGRRKAGIVRRTPLGLAAVWVLGFRA